LFGHSNNLQTYFCPGRVNLIGEHIDYLGGLVLPTAISLGITAICRPNSEREIRLYSTDFVGTSSLNLDELSNSKQNHWSDFVLGVILHLQQNGVEVQGCDILVSSTLPKASGLSSSAALEVLCYYMFYHVAIGNGPDRVQMALDCQKIENEFIGVNCGIMDQFAVANGKPNHAIMLDCNTLENEPIPLNLGSYSLLIINSNKPRTLAEIAYNQRRAECDKALQILKQSREMTNLINTKEDDLKLLKNEVLQRRTKHAFTEQQRVLNSKLALVKGDLKEFGKFLNDSHYSLRHDYNVSCTELDFIVDQLSKSEYCLGARMTGAGFGGCCIALIDTNHSKELQSQLMISYTKRFGFPPSFYNTSSSGGVHKVRVD
jgi:galactokinase